MNLCSPVLYPNSSNLGKKKTKQNKAKQKQTNKQTKKKKKGELIETTLKRYLHLFQEEA